LAAPFQSRPGHGAGPPGVPGGRRSRVPWQVVEKGCSGKEPGGHSPLPLPRTPPNPLHGICLGQAGKIGQSHPTRRGLFKAACEDVRRKSGRPPEGLASRAGGRAGVGWMRDIRAGQRHGAWHPAAAHGPGFSSAAWQLLKMVIRKKNQGSQPPALPRTPPNPLHGICLGQAGKIGQSHPTRCPGGVFFTSLLGVFDKAAPGVALSWPCLFCPPPTSGSAIFPGPYPD